MPCASTSRPSGPKQRPTPKADEQMSRAARHVLKHPLAFLRQAVDGFNANQGLLLAGAVAYYALLSLIPLLILSVIGLSHLVEQEELFAALGRYLEWLVPSQSKAVLADVSGFMENRITIGLVLFATMLFFSSLAFSVVEKAMAVIFHHRKASQPRHTLVSAVLPYSFILICGAALLGLTIVSVVIQAAASEALHLFGRDWSLAGTSGLLLYLLGLGTEACLLTAIYVILPAGQTSMRHAVLGGVVVTALWEVVRHLLIWYFTTLSKASVVYGSLTTAVVALLSMEIAAMLLLFGAQVISEYERIEKAPLNGKQPS